MKSRYDRPEHLDGGVLVELRRLVADRLPVRVDRVEHHPEHGHEDDQEDPIISRCRSDMSWATVVTGVWKFRWCRPPRRARIQRADRPGGKGSAGSFHAFPV